MRRIGFMASQRCAWGVVTEFLNGPPMSAASRKLRQRLEQLRLAYGMGEYVDVAELDRLIMQLREGTREHGNAQMLRASVLFQEDRLNECIAALDHLIDDDPSNAEARILLAAAHRERGIEDARAALASVNPNTLDDDDRIYYWFELLQTELAAWDPRSLSASLNRMPEADQNDETLQLLVDEAKAVLNYIRAHSTKGVADARDK